MLEPIRKRVYQVPLTAEFSAHLVRGIRAMNREPAWRVGVKRVRINQHNSKHQSVQRRGAKLRPSIVAVGCNDPIASSVMHSVQALQVDSFREPVPEML